MLNYNRQLVFLDLFAHIPEGNFAAFDKLARKAWDLKDQNNSNHVLVHNQIQACHMSGLIDVFETETSLRWSANLKDFGIVWSNRPKQIFRGSDKRELLIPLIIDGQNNTLIYGSSTPPSTDFVNAFPFTPDLFFKFLPSPRVLMNELIRTEPWPRDAGLLVERFDLVEKSWFTTEFIKIELPSLIRRQGEFSGRTYLVVIPDLQLAFRISSPEWVFILSMKLLSWKFDQIFSYDGKNFRFNSKIKVPGLIKRFLFANADQAKCGSETEFVGFCDICYAALVNYLSNTEIE